MSWQNYAGFLFRNYYTIIAITIRKHTDSSSK